ncbi:hypothetical protein QYF36_027287 [Acer negundo]|nr:hypothetical protein QYF36_027287 [Acer negundo]
MCCRLKGLVPEKSFSSGSGKQDVELVVPWAEEFLAEFCEANSVAVALEGRVRPDSVKWRPPEDSLLKLNTDASIDMLNPCVGLGMAIRDSRGWQLVPKSWEQSGCNIFCFNFN